MSQYKVVEEVELDGMPLAVGDVVEMTEEQAAGFGAKVELVSAATPAPEVPSAA